MTKQNIKIVEREIRGVQMNLLASNRSLDLCSQMNYETENLDFIDHAEKGAIFYDLGACEGRFSVYAAKKELKVLAFEPEKRNFGALTKNYELNFSKESNLTIFNMGVGSENEEIDMLIGQPWEGGHLKVVENENIRQDLNFEVKEKQKVKIVRLDDIIQNENLPIPNYLKIDVDGSEVSFLGGASKTLENDSLKKILFELDVADENFFFIFSKLTSYGFKEISRHMIPNEETLYNIIFSK